MKTIKKHKSGQETPGMAEPITPDGNAPSPCLGIRPPTETFPYPEAKLDPFFPLPHPFPGLGSPGGAFLPGGDKVLVKAKPVGARDAF